MLKGLVEVDSMHGQRGYFSRETDSIRVKGNVRNKNISKIDEECFIRGSSGDFTQMRKESINMNIGQ